MVSVNHVGTVAHVQPKHQAQAEVSFNGAAVDYSVDENRSKSTDYLKIGVAMAAAAGIGFLARRPKVVEKIVEKASAQAANVADDLTKAAPKIVNPVSAETYKILAKNGIKLKKGQQLVRQGNLAKIIDEKSGNVMRAVTFNTDGKTVSRIANFEYNESGKLINTTVQKLKYEYKNGVLSKVLYSKEPDLSLGTILKGVNKKDFGELISLAKEKNSIVGTARKFMKENPSIAENIRKSNISIERFRHMLLDAGVTPKNAKSLSTILVIPRVNA